MTYRLLRVVSGGLFVICVAMPSSATVTTATSSVMPLGPVARSVQPRRRSPHAMRVAKFGRVIAVTAPPGCLRNGSGNFSFVGGGQQNFAGGGAGVTGDAGVLAGYGNEACDLDSAVGAGASNSIGGDGSSSFSVVTGGQANAIAGSQAFIGAGNNNALGVPQSGSFSYANVDNSAIVGGQQNTISAPLSFVGAGSSNGLDADSSVIVGGGSNSVSSFYNAAVGYIATSYSGILGGQSNGVAGSFSAIAGGQNNGISAVYSFIGGGKGNSIPSFMDCTSTRTEQPIYGVISGGSNNLIAHTCFGSADNATIGGGTQNNVDRPLATIAGGGSNSASASSAAIGGGSSNTISAYGRPGGSVVGVGGPNGAAYSTIAGGLQNTIDSLVAGGALYGTIGGGYKNTITGGYGTIGGGNNNVAGGIQASVSGGYGNSASGRDATIPGGASNVASGRASFAAGSGSHAVNDGTFVWSDYSAGAKALVSSASNQFLARAAGGFVLYSAANLSTGVKLAAGSGSWSTLSDRSAKMAIEDVDNARILAKVASLPVSEWSYSQQGAGIRHIGPMAQDFRAAFGLGEDEKHIATIDEEGVALAAIKALKTELIEKDRKLITLDTKYARLERRLDALETAMHVSNGRGRRI